mgnify:FL=1|jgi:hypothetical protein
MADNKNDEELKRAFERLDKLTAPVKQHLSPAKDTKMEYRTSEIYKPDFSEMFPKVSNTLPDFSNCKSPAETIEEMKKELEKSNQEIINIEAELQAERQSRKHSTLKQILITMLGCVVSFLLGHFLH